ncbi:ferritin-like domain-containing protein, partial [Parvimonas micra]|uniref:ferritin-like domain-containing protein n=1 Tax=Parvimonas micra TaxID=33033 RepID=UPI002B48ED83
GIAHGTIATVARRSTLPPYPEDVTQGIQHVQALANAVASFGAQVRSSIDEAARAGDADTSDLFTGISREVDKDLWFLEAHLHAE